jgi:hypothetical protein
VDAITDRRDGPVAVALLAVAEYLRGATAGSTHRGKNVGFCISKTVEQYGFLSLWAALLPYRAPARTSPSPPAGRRANRTAGTYFDATV